MGPAFLGEAFDVFYFYSFAAFIKNIDERE